jgi:translocation and assembly module TamB
VASNAKIRKIFLKVLKVSGWIALSILTLLVLLIILIRLPAVQNKITQRAILFLENKIGTKVQLRRAFISFPKKIVLEGLYVEDQAQDTLVYAGELTVDADLWALTKNKIEVNTINLSNFSGKIRRTATDSSFNFTYIINAFAGNATPEETDTTAKPWTFSIEDVSLKSISILYDDRYTGNFLKAKIGELTLDIKELDPAKSIYKAGVVSIQNVTALVEQHKLPEITNDLGQDLVSTLPDIGFEEINLKKIQLSYAQVPLKQYLTADLDQVYVDVNKINLPENQLDIDNIELSHSFLSYNFYQKDAAKVEEKKTKPFAGLYIPWDINVRDINLSDNNIQYYNTALPVEKGSLDFNHLWVFGLQCEISNVAIKGNTLKGEIESLSFQEKSNFALQTFELDFSLEEKELVINKLLLESGRSKFSLSGTALFNSFTDYPTARVNLEVPQSTLAIKDILFFAPHLLDSVPVKIPPEASLTLTTKIRGTVNDLIIERFNVKTLKNTSLVMKGTVKGLPDMDKTVLQISLDGFHTTSRDAYAIIADSLIPSSIQIPDTLELEGSFNGKIKSPVITAILKTSSGDVVTHGKFNFNGTPSYSATLKTSKLNLGKILKQPETIGLLDMQASVTGSGISMEEMNTKVYLLVSRFQYSGYTYKDLKVNGSVNKYLFAGEASLHDENLDFIIQGDFDYAKEVPLYNLNVNLVNADFQKLNLSENPLKARGGLEVNLATADFKVINGNMAIYKVGIYNGESLYLVDSLLFAGIDQEGKSSMTIRSEILDGKFEGTFNLFSIGTVMKQHINHYFALHDASIKKNTTPQNFKFELILKNTDLITEILVPDLEPFVPGIIQGEFDSEENKLDVDIDLTKVKYATTSFDSISFHVESDDTELNYRLRLKNILLDTLTIDALQVTGRIENDSIYSAVQIQNSKNENKYVLGGVFRSQENNFRFRFLKDQVMLNYSEWSVPDDNYLEFSKEGFVAHNFTISKGQEKIGLVTAVKDSTISVEFQQLQLSNLTRVVRGVMPANGVLNGNVKFTTASRGRFNSKLQINELEVLEQPFGDLTLDLTHADDRYNIDLLIKNKGSNLNANGYYVSNPATSNFDLSVDLDPLNLELVEPLSFGQLKSMKGQAVGNLKVTGNLDNPVIRGKVTFRDASFKSTYLNSAFTLNNESIVFNETGIVLNNFTIQDSRKNDATIDGSILTKSYKEFRFNLNMSTRNFQVLNTTADNNKLYYGKVKLNAKAKITGSANRPRVDVTVGFSDDTDLTYVVPQAQKSVMEQKGIVEFVDKDAYKDPFLANLNISDTTRATFAGMNISANLELTDKETLNIVIDPITGDKLTVKGNSTLTFDMDASGNMSLSGRYEITEGTYNFSFYKLVKREFKIVKGGSITWSGDPLNAQINIRASHLVETSPMDLLSSQSPTPLGEAYRQRLPFYVFLDIKGELLAPLISFKLDMPADKQSALQGAVYAKILDINTRESDLNKQVFALLILRRFISENPLENQAGSDIANTTRTSVSRLLSDQLNRLSENVKGVQLSLDIKSYEEYSSGQAQGNTQVQLGVSKSLLNDRLVVKLSGNVSVEGENTTQRNAADYIGDLALEYKITSDGRFRITGFRTSNYDMIDGELIETGAGLIYIKDYNTLRELFKANDAEKK